jgi:hypothetical protein
MARPKTREEWEIYEYLKEHYVEEGIVGQAPINNLFYDQDNELSWEELKRDMERTFHY